MVRFENRSAQESANVVHMGLLGRKDRRVRRGIRALAAVASGLGAGAALAVTGVGAGCSGTPAQYCDVLDGMAVPPICPPPVDDAGNAETGNADASPLLDAGDAGDVGDAASAGDAAEGNDAAADAASSLGCPGQCVSGGPLFWTDPELV